MASESLRQFYLSIGSEADLLQLIRDEIQEGVYLEFKQKKDRSRPDLDESDAFQFSRALSGFANSDGGIILWGMESDSHERAKQLKPITDVLAFQSRLKKSLLNAVQPMLSAVLIEAIPSASAQGAGFVKCLIPQSDTAPHRALLAKREYGG